MIGKPYFGLRLCASFVRVAFGPQRMCSNPATRKVGDVLLCANHLRGEGVKVTIEFEQRKLDGTAAAKIVLAVKRSIDTSSGDRGPIADEDGAVIGHWKAEHEKKRKAA